MPEPARMLLARQGVMQHGDVKRKAAVAEPMSTVARRYPVGAELHEHGVHFRVWAPQRAYFADHEPELAALVASGRREFLEQFPSLATDAMKSRLPVPHDPEVFRRCRIDWDERVRNGEVLAMHRDLLRLRKDDAPFAAPDDFVTPWLDGAVLNDRAFVLRTFRPHGDDRLLIVNLGALPRPQSFADPLLAPPLEKKWTLCWSSEAPDHGGSGTAGVLNDGRWSIPARCTLLLAATEMETM